MLQDENKDHRIDLKASQFKLSPRLQRLCSASLIFEKNLNTKVKKKIHLTHTGHPDRKFFVHLCQYSLSRLS